MSMTNDILGFGRSAYLESTDALEPEIASMTLEETEDLPEGTDLMEFMTGVAYECDLNIRNMELAIVCDEYNYLRENGEEIIYEENRIQSIIDKFKSSVKWLWEQIQKFYKSAIKKIDEFLKLDQRFVDKYKAKASKNIGYYNGPEEKTVSDYVGKASEHIKALKEQSAIIADTYLKDSNFTDSIKKNDDKFMDKNMKTVFKAVYGKSSKDGMSNGKDVYSSFMDVLKKEKQNRKMSGKDACTKLLKCKDEKAKLKKTYDASKQLINEHLRAAKKAESVAKKFKVIPTELSASIHKVVRILSTIGKWCAQGNKFGIKMINMLRNIYKAIITSAAAVSYKGSKNRKKKDKDEERDNINSDDEFDGMVPDMSSALNSYEPGMTI